MAELPSAEARSIGTYGLAQYFAAAVTMPYTQLLTTAEETRDPQRNLPRGILGGLAVVTVLYVLVTIVVTGMVSYAELAKVDEPSLTSAFVLVGAGQNFPFGGTSILIVVSVTIDTPHLGVLGIEAGPGLAQLDRVGESSSQVVLSDVYPYQGRYRVRRCLEGGDQPPQDGVDGHDDFPCRRALLVQGLFHRSQSGVGGGDGASGASSAELYGAAAPQGDPQTACQQSTGAGQAGSPVSRRRPAPCFARSCCRCACSSR